MIVKRKDDMMNRELDGVYFRVERDNKYDNVCFSDLTEEEMKDVLQGRDVEWMKSLCIILGKKIKEIGDYFDIYSVEADEYNEEE